jgi:iron complex transport system substrate-binding protein
LDAPSRIVSLLPAATETLFALGAGPRVVGVSHECDHPEAARALPRVSRAKVDVHASSRSLDAEVKEFSRRKESLYEVDGKLLRRLRPDLVVTQVQCDVCAVTPEDVKRVTEGLDPKPTVLALDAQSIEGVLGDIRRLGTALDLVEEAKLLILRQWRLTKEIRSRVRDLEPPNVALIDWVDPLMFAGNWMPDLAGMAGGRYRLVETGKPSRWGSWDELEDAEPDVIVAAPCGRGVAQTRAEMTEALARFAPGDLPPLDKGRIYLADGNQYFNRPGPRLIYGAALLARAFHGDAIPPLPDSLERELVSWTGVSEPSLPGGN